MSKKEEKKYRVTSPIKRGGKKYGVNASIILTEEEAEGLHVVPFEEGAEKSTEAESSAKSSPSMGLNAKNAVRIINNTELEDLEGFVIPEPEGNEDRVTVLDAWKEKHSSDEEEEASKDDSKKKK